MTTFVCTHSWLNWIDEDDFEDEVGLKDDIKMRLEASGVWAEDTGYIKRLNQNETPSKHRECGQTKHNRLDFQLYAIIGNCILWNGQVCHSLTGPGSK